MFNIRTSSMIETKTCGAKIVEVKHEVSPLAVVSTSTCAQVSACLPTDKYYDYCHGVCRGDGSTERQAKRFKKKKREPETRTVSADPATRAKPAQVAKADRPVVQDLPKVAVPPRPAAPATRVGATTTVATLSAQRDLRIAEIVGFLVDGAIGLVVAMPRAKIETRSSSVNGAFSPEFLGGTQDHVVRGVMMVAQAAPPRGPSHDAKSPALAVRSGRAPIAELQRVALSRTLPDERTALVARGPTVQPPVRLVVGKRAVTPIIARVAQVGMDAGVAGKPKSVVVHSADGVVPELNPAEAALALAQAGMLVPPDQPSRSRGAVAGELKMDRARNPLVAKASPSKQSNDERHEDRRKEEEGQSCDDSAEPAV